MYEVVTAIKTCLVTNDKEEAFRRAEELFKVHNYIEVKEVLSYAPYYAQSLKIFYR